MRQFLRGRNKKKRQKVYQLDFVQCPDTDNTQWAINIIATGRQRVKVIHNYCGGDKMRE